MGTHPFADNPLRTRADLQRAVRDLFEPLVPAYREGGARVRLGTTGALFDTAAEHLEGFARPLWGIAPLAAGGGAFEHWGLVQRGLCDGTDPDHPQYWGEPQDGDQRLVEMAAIGLALALVPEHVWEPLPHAARSRLATWLAGINRREPHRNNWQFFRVLVNLGLRRVGAAADDAADEAAFAELERHWVGDGWYRDGEFPGNFDHYIGWAYHFYGLLYAELAGGRDPGRAARFRERACRFALDFQHWFDPRGAVIPFGRSLTYRFAAASFWAALAFADEEALPWGVIKGLCLRHLREWSRHPIARPNGVLSIGYAYENLFLSENYNSPGSPYWAMKPFLVLALPEEHPFWQAQEAPQPVLPKPSVQAVPGVILSRDSTQAQMLNGGRGYWFVRQGAAKYGKLAYSSIFGFSLDSDDPWLGGVSDSMLMFVTADGQRFVRHRVANCVVRDGAVYSRWQPCEGITVDTMLTGLTPWHVRVHRVRTERAVHTVEAGFAVGWGGGDPREPAVDQRIEAGLAAVTTPAGLSVIVALQTARGARVVKMAPNTSVIWSRTLVPVLDADLGPGEHTLACAVAATDVVATVDADCPPALQTPLWEVLDT